MAVLTVTRGPSKGVSITLLENQTYTIGAAPDASIRIAGSDVAERHIVIKALKGGGFGAKGLAGSFQHNGRAVEAARLSPGDTLEVGGATITIRAIPDSAGDGEQLGTIGGFRLLGVLGKGGMGTVYRAMQMSLNREVALKVLSHDLTADPVFVARFQAEARAAARLHHPNVVQVYDVDHDGETYFYSMELMHAGSVEQRLKRDGRVPVEDALSIVRDAASGLAFAESLRIVHRDIKPDNLMIDRHGHVKLADLGIALLDSDGDGKLVGTPHFMAPEQIQRKTIDHRTDLYALGCTFYRLVSGTTPAKGDTVKQILLSQLKDAPVPAHKVADDVPLEVSAIIDRLLAKDPADRFQSATDLLAAIESVQTPATRRGLWIGIAIAAFVAACSAIGWALTREPETRIVTRADPEAEAIRAERERLEAEKRESDATAALLEVRLRGLEGYALAEAFDAMATAHPDTRAAREASAEATAIRAERQRLEAAAAERSERLERAAERVRSSFDAALAGADLDGAHRILGLSDVPNDLRPDARIVALSTELRTRLDEAAAARLTALQAVVTDAIEANADGEILAGLVPLRELRDGDHPWLDAPARTAITAFIESAQQTAAQLAEARALREQRDAWARLGKSTLDAGGIRDQILALDHVGASAGARAVAAELGETLASTRAALLADACDHAARYVAAFEASLQATETSVPFGAPEEAAVIVALARHPQPGFQLRVGQRPRMQEQFIRLADVPQAQLARYFPELDGREPIERTAHLALLSVANVLRDVPSYLATIAPADDTSGTGDAGFRLGEQSLDDLVSTLENAPESVAWAKPLAEEVRAARLVSRSLRAMSGRRNLSAAGLLDQLLAEHARTLLVQCLQ